MREIKRGFVLIGDGIVNLKENLYNQDVIFIDDDESKIHHSNHN